MPPIFNYRGESMNTIKLKFSTVVSIALILFSSAYFIQSLQYEYWYGYGPGAGFMPRWSSGFMLGLSIICLIQSIKEDGIKLSEFLPKGVGRVNLLITWLGLICFALFAKKLGLIVTSIILLTILFNRGTKLRRAFILAVIVSLCCFVLFKIILQVPVPVNKFGW